MTLTRKEFGPKGIFGELRDEAGNLLAVTLEHAYALNGKWQPKIPPGNYQCVRGPHRLHGMTESFSTFEITGVPGHSNLLFHWGNFNDDSEGCVLLGQTRIKNMITYSKVTFHNFMQHFHGEDRFMLRVV